MRFKERCGPNFCTLEETSTHLIKAATPALATEGSAGASVQQTQLSAPAYHRTQSVKLARTIADLAGAAEIQTAHLAEAIQYRPQQTV